MGQNGSLNPLWIKFNLFLKINGLFCLNPRFAARIRFTMPERRWPL